MSYGKITTLNFVQNVKANGINGEPPTYHSDAEAQAAAQAGLVAAGIDADVGIVQVNPQD